MAKTVNGLDKSLQTNLDLSGYAAKSHTHNYAGSSSAGGAATSANKLNTNAGGTMQPVYFSGGVPVALTAFKNNVAAGALGWSSAANDIMGITSNTLAYWNGAYNNTNSNLAYCKHGALGTAATKNIADFAAASHGTHLTIGTGAGNAAAGNHTHSYLPLSGGQLASSEFGTLSINRNNSAYAASIQFKNTNGVLGSIGMTGTKDGGLIRWSSDTSTSTSGTQYTILDTGNYKTHVTPANIGAAASSHGTHLTIGTGASNAAAGNHTHSNYATTTTTGSLSSLQTTAKGSLVAAINEVFQSGNNAKTKLVDALVAKGASASTSDTWDTLISKVSTVGSGVDIISATELPATGKENQICVITDTPVNDFLLTTELTDIQSLTTDTIGSLICQGQPSSAAEGGFLQTTNNISYTMCLKYFIQNSTYLASYIYKNGSWTEFTLKNTYFIKDKYYVDPNPFGTFASNSANRRLAYFAGYGLTTYYNSTYGYYYMWNTTSVKIDFSGYNTIIVKCKGTNLSSWESYPTIEFFSSSNAQVAGNQSETYFSHPSYIAKTSEVSVPKTLTELYFDISSWSGQYYLGVVAHVKEDSSVTGRHIVITDISFM